MFIETAVALFTIGFLLGTAVVYLIGCQPYARENDALRLRLAERRYEDEKNARAYREHKGTPYLRTSGVVDNHSGSRKALEVVQ